MPPKQAPNKKTQEKLKTKIIEDKTFGLKNKKGAKQQKFIQAVQKQVQNKIQGNRPPRDLLEDQNKKKEEEKKKKEEIAALFKPVAQTVAKGVDPKSVVCVYFKQNLCQKGDKCKFSHDLNIERKSEKRNIYEDTREPETMEGWDEQKLEDVIDKKHGEDNKRKNQTQIVCKYFIEAVENKTYGWFWACPNGENCIYRHALPPGFTLKSEMAKKGKDDEEVSLEMLIEKERASLGQGTTRVTLETFLAWKARKIQEKKDEHKKSEEKKMKEYKLGFMNGLTGRDIFTFNPDLITNDDDEAQADIDYRRREDEDELDEAIVKQCRELNPEYFAAQAQEADGTGTVATDDRFAYLESLLATENARLKRVKEEREAAEAAAAAEAEEEGEEEGEEEDEEEAGDDEDDNNEGEEDEENEEEEKQKLKNLVSNNNKNGSKKKTKLQNGIEVDESLFNLEELQDLEEELENLDI